MIIKPDIDRFESREDELFQIVREDEFVFRKHRIINRLSETGFNYSVFSFRYSLIPFNDLMKSVITVEQDISRPFKVAAYDPFLIEPHRSVISTFTSEQVRGFFMIAIQKKRDLVINVFEEMIKSMDPKTDISHGSIRVVVSNKVLDYLYREEVDFDKFKHDFCNLQSVHILDTGMDVQEAANDGDRLAYQSNQLMDSLKLAIREYNIHAEPSAKISSSLNVQDLSNGIVLPARSRIPLGVSEEIQKLSGQIASSFHDWSMLSEYVHTNVSQRIPQLSPVRENIIDTRNIGFPDEL